MGDMMYFSGMSYVGIGFIYWVSLQTVLHVSCVCVNIHNRPHLPDKRIEVR